MTKTNYTQTDSIKALRKIKPTKPKLTPELLEQLAKLQGVKRRKVN